LSAEREAASDPIARLKPARNGRATLEIPRNESPESNLHLRQLQAIREPRGRIAPQ
jgi:hypothetical protein